MANVVSKTLQLETSNVEQYCSADGLSLNAGGYAIRKWLNGSNSGYATLNDAAKNVLYPTSTAHPFKLDSEIRGSRSAGSMTVVLQFGNTNVHSASYSSTSLSNKTSSNIATSAVTSSTRNTRIRWNVQGANANAQRVAHVKLVLYFNQYTMSANKGTGANGVQSVSVSNSAPYEGDTVTFTTKLVNGATWDGWYSDASCTQLVSTEQNYTRSAADLTLYAKATIAATVYNCSAVAGENIASASVSDESVVSGESTIFSAVLNEHCIFDGWYSDSNYSTIVSTANPYTATITSDTTLYAKGTKISYSVSVGTAEHGVATVSANTAHYGDSVTFTFTPEDNTWELYGWYSDEGLTQLVSESNPYTHSVTGNIVLYPKVGKKRYIISFGRDADFLNGNNFQIDIAVLYYNQLTRTEINYLRTGEYDKIDASKILLQDSISGNNINTSLLKTIKCPYDAYIAVYAPPKIFLTTTNYSWFIKDGETVTRWPYYWFQPIKDTKITSDGRSSDMWCNCSAVPKEGIDYAYATTPTLQEYDAVFEAEVASGYTFAGWYSNEACTRLTSTDNPAYIKTPKSVGDTASTTSITLYAKATKISAGTGLYVKSNGTYAEVQRVYKKINGIYVEQTDIASIMDPNTKYINMS